MSERLTDEQVAQLAEAHDSTVTWESHTFTFTMTGKEPIRRHVRAETVKALALEVQQARQRRCQNCASWHTDNRLAGRCGLHPSLTTAYGFHCADFTPKEER